MWKDMTAVGRIMAGGTSIGSPNGDDGSLNNPSIEDTPNFENN